MTGTDRPFGDEHWSLAIFSSRETSVQLMRVVRAAIAADHGGATLTIDIVVNGNAQLATAMQPPLAALDGIDATTSVRLWFIPQPNKAHAWNIVLHTLLPLTQRAFFMDGYVMLDRAALVTIADAMRRHPEALAATAIPSTGPSARALRRQLLSEGGLHGNLFALTAATCARLRDLGVRLPYGLYRHDSALGAALAFNLDPARDRWRADRILVVPEARYLVPVPHLWRIDDIMSALRRRLRQAQGLLETRALQWHLATARRAPAAWPATAHELVCQWAEARPADTRSLLLTEPLAWSRLRQLRKRPTDSIPEGETQFLGRFPQARVPAVQRAPWLREA